MEQWVLVVLFLAAAFFFAFLEMFITSGGILIFIGAVLLLISIAFAFTIDMVFGSVYLLGLMVGGPAVLWFFFRVWPHSPIGRRILLHPETDPALQPNHELIALKSLVGKRGFARSKMMLAGLVEVEGKRISALSELETVEPGEEIVITAIDGISVLVRKVYEKAPAVASGDQKVGSTIEDPFS